MITTAVVLAARLTSTGSTLRRLIVQLEADGVREVIVLARPAWAAARPEAPLAVMASTVVRESPDAASDLSMLARLCSAAGAGPVATAILVADADLIAHDSVISGSVAVAGSGVTALTAALDTAALEMEAAVAASCDRNVPVRVDRGRVISAGSTFHSVTTPTATFAGLIAIGPAQVPTAAEALAAAGRSPAAATAGDGNPLALALVALVRAGIPVRAKDTAPLFCAPVPKPDDLTRLERALAAADEDDARMRSAVKSDDDLFATYAVSSWSPHVVRLAVRLGLGPTAVTLLSVVAALVAALGFAQGGRVAALAGVGLLYVSFVLDCVDGQLARYTQRFSRFGGWLDALGDRAKEYAVYAGLAVGAAVTDGVWPLAIAAITLQTVRHMTDSWYGFARDEAVARLALAPYDQADDGTSLPAGRGSDSVIQSLIDATSAGRRSTLYWIKKLMVFPIGERWLVIGVVAALFDARAVFLALLAWGSLAAVYTVVVRTLRSRALRIPSMGTVDVALHRDGGPPPGLVSRLGARLGGLGRRVLPLPSAGLAAAAGLAVAGVAVAGELGLGMPAGVRAASYVIAVGCLVPAALAGHQRHDGSLDWFVPGALRMAELLLFIGVGVLQGVPLPLLYGVLGVLALFHYDLTARLDKAGSPLVFRRLGLGWDGRLLLLLLAVVAGRPTLGFAGLAVYLVAVFVVGAVIGSRQGRRPTADATTLPPRPRAGGALADVTPRG